MGCIRMYGDVQGCMVKYRGVWLWMGVDGYGCRYMVMYRDVW